LDEQRREVARRQAVLARNSFVITRLHHRYDVKGLPEDFQLRTAGAVKGGLGIPAGPSAELPTAVEPAPENRLQVRYSTGYPSKKVVQCEAPQRWRWGIPPASYRGLRKTWTARDLAYKKRDRFVLKDVVKSNIAALGIAAAPPVPEETAAAPAAADAKPAAESKGCAIVGSTRPALAGTTSGMLALLLGLWVTRRRSAPPSPRASR
jgi:hypothetical protein